MRQRTLLTQVLAVNTVLVAVTAFVAAIIARERFSQAVSTQGLLLIGLAVLAVVLLNSLLLRRRLEPMGQLVEAMSEVDLASPGMRADVSRGAASEVQRLTVELEKVKHPPLVVGSVLDTLVDGRVVIKSSTGPNFVVPVADFVDRAKLTPGTRVSLSQANLTVVGILPSSKDAHVLGFEVTKKPSVTYKDVGGLEDVLRQVREAVEYPLTKPELFKKLGVTPPKGVLLRGLPGTGKTLLAKAVANATDATFIRLVASELVQKFIGEGARRVHEVFQRVYESLSLSLGTTNLVLVVSRTRRHHEQVARFRDRHRGRPPPPSP